MLSVLFFHINKTAHSVIYQLYIIGLHTDPAAMDEKWSNAALCF